MSKVPSNWFGDPRPLPLNKNGVVDFSQESEIAPQVIKHNTINLTNPVRGAYLISLDMHNRFGANQVFFLQGWHSIIVANSLSNGAALSKYDRNHNIFRLDASGNVVWQVQRDEQGFAEWRIKALKKAARGDEHMQHLTNQPFARLSTAFFKRGIYNEFEETQTKYISETWKPDYVLLAWGYGRRVYELDIETGVAKNVTQPGGRDW